MDDKYLPQKIYHYFIISLLHIEMQSHPLSKSSIMIECFIELLFFLIIFSQKFNSQCFET